MPFIVRKLKLIVALLILNCAVFPVFAQKGSAQSVKTVVIDAGHGGKDPGTHGDLVNEKTVCLRMALDLGALIKKNYPDVKVIYTRDSDKFVELDERAAIANRNKADLFICIHANSASPEAYGVETYVLGLHRTEAQLRIAQKENSSIYLEDDGGAKYKDFDLSPDALIFKQLQMATYLKLAIKFATNLQHEFKALGRHDRGVKQAGFLVLYKTTMPSVLIETGFLTNDAEERFLNSPTAQQKMANAMFVAFQKYKNQIEGVNVLKGVHPVQKYDEPDDENPVKKDYSDKSSSKEKDEISADKSADDKVVYRVQIKTSSTRLSSTSSAFHGLKVFEYRQNGAYKYTAGAFENMAEANKYKNELRAGSFKDAFVIPFYKGERISFEEALKHSK